MISNLNFPLLIIKKVKKKLSRKKKLKKKETNAFNST